MQVSVAYGVGGLWCPLLKREKRGIPRLFLCRREQKSRYTGHRRSGPPACDNGPEFTSRHFLAWGVERGIEIIHIQPGKPQQNARVESFHGRLREECLNVSWFQNLFDARRKIAAWRIDYNEKRPHSSLGYRTPQEFAEQARSMSYGKDGDKAALENASGVSHFPTAPATAAEID